MITIYFERDSDLPEPVCYKSVEDAVDWICDGYPTYNLDSNVLFGTDNRKCLQKGLYSSGNQETYIYHISPEELQIRLNEIRANAIADTEHDYSLNVGGCHA